MSLTLGDMAGGDEPLSLQIFPPVVAVFFSSFRIPASFFSPSSRRVTHGGPIEAFKTDSKSENKNDVPRLWSLIFHLTTFLNCLSTWVWKCTLCPLRPVVTCDGRELLKAEFHTSNKTQLTECVFDGNLSFNTLTWGRTDFDNFWDFFVWPPLIWMIAGHVQVQNSFATPKSLTHKSCPGGEICIIAAWKIIKPCFHSKVSVLFKS